MPFSPSDLPWWGSLLCSLGAGFVFGISGFVTRMAFEDKKIGRACVGLLAAIPSSVVASVSFSVGVIRFVKWVWFS
jgi:hypothetical protein